MHLELIYSSAARCVKEEGKRGVCCGGEGNGNIGAKVNGDSG